MLFKINTKNIHKDIKFYFVSTASEFKLQKIFKKKEIITQESGIHASIPDEPQWKH